MSAGTLKNPGRPDLSWLVANPIAHRGLHDLAAGVIENSPSAATAAIAGGFGIECDVQLTADGEASRYALGLQDKLMGQVNLALASRGVLRRGGSITLTSGTTSDDPILGGSSLSMVNGALEAWVRAAATEWTDDVRINLVSPSLVEGTPAQAMKAFPGIAVVSGKQVALAYLRCLFSGIRGQTLRI